MKKIENLQFHLKTNMNFKLSIQKYQRVSKEMLYIHIRTKNKTHPENHQTRSSSQTQSRLLFA